MDHRTVLPLYPVLLSGGPHNGHEFDNWVSIGEKPGDPIQMLSTLGKPGPRTVSLYESDGEVRPGVPIQYHHVRTEPYFGA